MRSVCSDIGIRRFTKTIVMDQRLDELATLLLAEAKDDTVNKEAIKKIAFGLKDLAMQVRIDEILAKQQSTMYYQSL